MDFYQFSVILLWIIAIIQTLLFFYLAKLVANFLNRFRINGNTAITNKLVIGEKTPFFREKDHMGRTVALHDYNDTVSLLIFLSNETSRNNKSA